MSLAAIAAVIVMALLLGFIAGWMTAEHHVTARHEYQIAELEEAENVRRRDMRGRANENFFNARGVTR